MCKRRTCLDCNNFATCEIVKSMCDENDRVDVMFLNIYANDCKKYINFNE